MAHITPVDIPDQPTVAQQSGEPILKAGGGVAAGVAAAVALADRLGAPVLEGDATLITLFISAVVIPFATWIIARRNTVTVPKANAAIKMATAIQPGTPVLGFGKGSSGPQRIG